MPLSFSVAAHGSNPTQLKQVKTSAELLKDSARDEFDKIERIIQSSFTDEDLTSFPVEASLNGFVNTVLCAYNQHHHLILRPDDIWQAIILQFNLYVNAHAEELRHLFVAHKDKKDLEVRASGSTDTYDRSQFPIEIGKVIEKNVLDAKLRAWIVSDFSTTTTKDKVVASITMMATLQAYFTYSCYLSCGIPQVTLLGDRDDWVRLRARIDKLPSFGEEPTKWYDLLVPVLTRFIRAFDSPNSKANVDFWQKVCHRHSGGSGEPHMTGWITGFCFWNKKGLRLDEYGRERGQLEVDGVGYHRVDDSQLAAGWVGVRVSVDDNGYKFEARMVAGHVGIGGSVGDDDSVRPVSGWWMCKLKKK